MKVKENLLAYNIDQSKVQCILAKLDSENLREETINETMTEIENIF